MYESLDRDYTYEIKLNCMKHTVICILLSIMCTAIICVEWLVFYPKGEWIWWL